MEKIENIKAFAEWNNKQIYSIRFMLRLFILNVLFSGGIYILAGVAKVSTELSVFKWICVIMVIFLFFMMLYLLINFKRKRAGLSLFYAMTMVNLSLAFGGMGLFTGFFINHHTLSSKVIALYVISYFSMFILGFLLNNMRIIKGKYVTAGSPKKFGFYGIFAALGLLASSLMRRFITENTKAEIAVIASILVSFLFLLAASNCFLRWYYILRYKV